MTFLFRSELSIVLVPPPTENSRSLGGQHEKRNDCFLRLRITEVLDRVQFDLLITVIKFIYSAFLWPSQFGEGGQSELRLMHSPTMSGSMPQNRLFFGRFLASFGLFCAQKPVRF